MKLSDLRPNASSHQSRSVQISALGAFGAIRITISSTGNTTSEHELTLGDQANLTLTIGDTPTKWTANWEDGGKLTLSGDADVIDWSTWFSDQDLTVTTSDGITPRTETLNNSPEIFFGRHEFIFLLDTSGSMLQPFAVGTPTRWTALLSAIGHFATAPSALFAPDEETWNDIDKIAAVTFGGNNVQKILDFTTPAKLNDDLIPALQEPHPGAQTPLGRGIARALGISEPHVATLNSDSAPPTASDISNDSRIFTESLWNKRHIIIFTDGRHNLGISPEKLNELVGAIDVRVATVQLIDSGLPDNYPAFLSSHVYSGSLDEQDNITFSNLLLPPNFLATVSIAAALRACMKDALGIETIRTGAAGLRSGPDFRTHAFTLCADDRRFQAVLHWTRPVQLALVDPEGQLIPLTAPSDGPRLDTPFDRHPDAPLDPRRDPRHHADSRREQALHKGIDVRVSKSQAVVTIDLLQRRTGDLPANGKWRLLCFHGLAAEEAFNLWKKGFSPLHPADARGPVWTFDLAAESDLRLVTPPPGARDRLAAFDLEPRLVGGSDPTLRVLSSSRPKEALRTWLDRTPVDPAALRQIAAANPGLRPAALKREALRAAELAPPRGRLTNLTPRTRPDSPTSFTLPISGDALEHAGPYHVTLRSTAKSRDGLTVERERRVEFHVPIEPTRADIRVESHPSATKVRFTVRATLLDDQDDPMFPALSVIDVRPSSRALGLDGSIRLDNDGTVVFDLLAPRSNERLAFSLLHRGRTLVDDHALPRSGFHL